MTAARRVVADAIGYGFRLDAKIWLVLAILVAFGLRVYHLGQQSIWWDEALSIYRAQQSLSFIVSNAIVIQDFVTQDLHPPLYFALLHFWIRLAGVGEFAVRFPSAILGTLLVPAIYVVGRHLLDRRAGLAAAGVVALSPFGLWYSQETRMYTMVPLLSLASVYLLIRALEKGHKGLYIGYALATAALLYTHYFALFVLFFEAIYFGAVWWQRPVSGRWRRLLPLLVMGLVWLPLFPYLVWRVSLGEEWGRQVVPLMVILRDMLVSYSLGISVDQFQVLPLAIGFLLISALALLPGGDQLLARRRWYLAALVGYILIPVVAVFAASYIKAIYSGSRYLSAVSPAYYLLLGAGVSNLSRRSRWLTALAILFVVIASGYSVRNYFFTPDYRKEDYRGLAWYVERRFQPGDALVLTSSEVHPAFFYYYRSDLPWYGVPHYGDVPDMGAIDRALTEVVGSHRRIWLVLSQENVVDPEGWVKAWLDQHAYQADRQVFWGNGFNYGIRLHLYLTESPVRPTAPPMEHPVAAQFGKSMLLLGYDEKPDEAAGMVRVTLYWQDLARMDTNYGVSLRVVDDQGHLWGQRDSQPLNGFYPTTRWDIAQVIVDPHDVPLLPGTPPGRYWLQVAVYSPTTMKSLEVTTPTTVGTGLRLGPLAISRSVSVGAREMAAPRLDARIGPLELVAADVGARVAKPGEEVPFILYWRARTPVEGQPVATVALRRGEHFLAEQTFPVGGGYPAALWREEELVAQQHRLLLPADVLAGEYQVVVAVRGSAEGQEWLANAGWLPIGQRWTAVGTVQVEARERTFSMPPVPYRLVRQVGDNIRFLGYDLKTRAVPAGSALQLTLYWQATGPVGASYKVFTHLIDGSERIWGQKDGVPANYGAPTTGWVAGEFITDRYEIPVRADTPAGGYLLAVGMYEESTGQRLPVFAADGTYLGDRIILGEVTVTR